ncbi:hypothetical protein Y1Q_0004198 [Alligator mississippiensis]|uniref:Uncharacterized protein n=1 Tax=Alligator mississippiensis TaxID=8496 RepID=A0A151PIM5_ALLMI|nr:hypothetical protein Y1Q_0004198 [Alligator mississippiensis]
MFELCLPTADWLVRTDGTFLMKQPREKDSWDQKENKKGLPRLERRLILARGQKPQTRIENREELYPVFHQILGKRILEIQGILEI